jgi:hypothetical protein
VKISFYGLISIGKEYFLSYALGRDSLQSRPALLAGLIITGAR